MGWLAFFGGIILHNSVAGPNGEPPLELNIKLVPGIWINGVSGPVNIECATNPNQTDGWTLLATVLITNNSYFYADANTTNAPQRYYRAMVGDASMLNPDPEHLVWIPSGTFLMGSPSNQGRPDQRPQTQVTISKGYWISKYETTQEEYLSVMGSNPSHFTGDLKRPVEQVTWSKATNYCGKLTIREQAAGRMPVGYSYRLPTEAEWEYACRAETQTQYNYGSDSGAQLADYAWYSDNCRNTTHPVGELAPNAWGLYDMYGNVWEWCLDWHSESLPGGSVTDPRGPKSGAHPVDRGGSWYDGYWNCTSAVRDDESWPLLVDGMVGFRVVLAQ